MWRHEDAGLGRALTRTKKGKTENTPMEDIQGLKEKKPAKQKLLEMHVNLGEWNRTPQEEERDSINKNITEKLKGRKTEL